jgi:hypothetical protein
MHVAAHRPEEIGAAAEQRIFAARQEPGFDQRLVRAQPIIIFGDPEQRLQVTLPAFAFQVVRRARMKW